jgi:hypothetical protein
MSSRRGRQSRLRRCATSGSDAPLGLSCWNKDKLTGAKPPLSVLASTLSGLFDRRFKAAISGAFSLACSFDASNFGLKVLRVTL